MYLDTDVAHTFKSISIMLPTYSKKKTRVIYAFVCTVEITNRVALGPSRVICISTDLALRSDRSAFSSSDPKMHK